MMPRSFFRRGAPGYDPSAPAEAPVGLAEALRLVRGLGLSPNQRAAAELLLTGLELDPLPAPEAAHLRRCTRPRDRMARVGAALWWYGEAQGRGLMITPITFDGTLQVHVCLCGGRGCAMIWTGWPACPVAAVRGMLTWVYAPRPGRQSQRIGK